MRRFILTLGAIAALGACGFLLLVAIEMLSNDMSAHMVAQSIYLIEHPEQSRHLRAMAAVKNVGGSNDCTWIGGEFRSSSLSRRQIEDFYSPRIISSYKTPNRTFEVHFQGDKDPYGQINEFMEELDRLATAHTKGIVYLILVADGLHHAGLDARCF